MQMAFRSGAMSSANSCKTLFSETHLKPYERFYIPNYHFYRIDRHPGRKGGTAVVVRKGIHIYW
jgi:hypothetical protein